MTAFCSVGTIVGVKDCGLFERPQLDIGNVGNLAQALVESAVGKFARIRLSAPEAAMGTLERLNLGIVGAAGRSGSFKGACDAIEAVRIHAVCDNLNLPGLISQQSIADGGRWLDVPDSRCW